jgi:hypothetical protein
MTLDLDGVLWNDLNNGKLGTFANTVMNVLVP